MNELGREILKQKIEIYREEVEAFIKSNTLRKDEIYFLVNESDINGEFFMERIEDFMEPRIQKLKDGYHVGCGLGIDVMLNASTFNPNAYGVFNNYTMTTKTIAIIDYSVVELFEV